MTLAVFIEASLLVSQVFLGVAMLCAFWRIFRGRRAQDRILGLETFYSNTLLSIVVYCIRVDTTNYMETALIIGMLGFTATIALAKFLMRGEVIE